MYPSPCQPSFPTTPAIVNPLTPLKGDTKPSSTRSSCEVKLVELLARGAKNCDLRSEQEPNNTENDRILDCCSCSSLQLDPDETFEHPRAEGDATNCHSCVDEEEGKDDKILDCCSCSSLQFHPDETFEIDPVECDAKQHYPFYEDKEGKHDRIVDCCSCSSLQFHPDETFEDTEDAQLEWGTQALPKLAPCLSLHEACSTSPQDPALIQAAMEQDVFRVLTRKRCPICGYSYPLHIAIHQQDARLDVLKLLIDAGPFVLLQEDGPHHFTPLCLALSVHPMETSLHTFLLASDSIPVKLPIQTTQDLPLHVACRSGAPIETLLLLTLEYAESVYQKNRKGHSPFDIVAAQESSPKTSQILDMMMQFGKHDTYGTDSSCSKTQESYSRSDLSMDAVEVTSKMTAKHSSKVKPSHHRCSGQEHSAAEDNHYQQPSKRRSRSESSTKSPRRNGKSSSRSSRERLRKQPPQHRVPCPHDRQTPTAENVADAVRVGHFRHPSPAMAAAPKPTMKKKTLSKVTPQTCGCPSSSQYYERHPIAQEAIWQWQTQWNQHVVAEDGKNLFACNMPKQRQDHQTCAGNYAYHPI